VRKVEQDGADAHSSKARLIQVSTELFSQKWYGTVSVAEICRKAGYSNGLFYRYFQSKEDIFKTILETVIADIDGALKKIGGEGKQERLKDFTRIIHNYSRDNPAPVKVFREGQYRFFEYERRLKAVYEEAYLRVFGMQPRLADYIFALGGLRFSAVRSAFHGIPVKLEELQRILSGGLYPGQTFDPERVFSTSISPLPIDIIPDARERILREGKLLIGRQGYFDTNIHEITSAASLSTGAFYTYFPSKEAFYTELIHRVGREVRRFISMNLDPSLSGLERELRGLWLFIVFLSLDRNCYGIVREAEFVLPAVVKEYYDAFVRGYRAPNRASPEETDTRIEFQLGVAHYLGIEVIFDHSPENAKNVIKSIGELYSGGFGALLAGS